MRRPLLLFFAICTAIYAASYGLFWGAEGYLAKQVKVVAAVLTTAWFFALLFVFFWTVALFARGAGLQRSWPAAAKVALVSAAAGIVAGEMVGLAGGALGAPSVAEHSYLLKLLSPGQTGDDASSEGLAPDLVLLLSGTVAALLIDFVIQALVAFAALPRAPGHAPVEAPT